MQIVVEALLALVILWALSVKAVAWLLGSTVGAWYAIITLAVAQLAIAALTLWVVWLLSGRVWASAVAVVYLVILLRIWLRED
jgi:hypothetical protein